MHDRTPDERPRSTRDKTGEGTEHYEVSTAGELPGRSRRSALRRLRSDRLWVADIPPQAGGAPSYVHTFTGWVYVAFVTDVFNREIVGWQVSRSLHTKLALDALQMGIYQRKRAGGDLSGLVHHSDRGVQYRAIRYGQALAEQDAVASVGSKGDSYDNALAEALNSLYKAELIRNKGPWRGIDDVEIATAEWVHWFNTYWPHGALGGATPAAFRADNFSALPRVA